MRAGVVRAARVGSGPLLGAAAATMLAAPAWAQSAGGVLPATGLGLGSGGSSFRSAVESILPGAVRVNTGLAWLFSGSIGASAGLVQGGGRNNDGGLEFFSNVGPEVNLVGDTRLLQVRLAYTPQLSLGSSSGVQLYQTGNASATATLWPDTLFLDARATTSYGSRFGGVGNSSTFLSRQEAVQTTTVSFSPRFTQRFGGWGTLAVGYQYARTLQDSNGNIDPNLVRSRTGGFASPGYGTTGNLATQSEYVSFVTGENLGRWNDAISATTTQSGGAALYQGTTQDNFSNRLSYAATRWLTLIGTIGYETIRYPSVGYSLSEATWQVGATFAPNTDSTLTVLYGRTQGNTSFSVDGAYSPTTKTRLSVRYSEGVDTGLNSQQRLLQTTIVGPGGILLDRQTGFPVQAGSPLGSQFGLSRVKLLSISGTLLLNRDVFSASVTNEDSTTLVSSTSIVGVTAPPGTSTNVVSGALAWVHDINPTTNLSNSFSYSLSNNGALLGNPGTSSEVVTFTSSLGHSFTESLSGNVTYSYTDRTGAALRGLPSSFGGSSTQNSVLVGLRKSF